MGTNKGKKGDEVKGFEIDNLLSGDETFQLRFGFLNLTMKLLTAEDEKEAARYARLPGGSPKKPKRDDDKYAESLLGACVVSWEHIDGHKIMNGGKELKCTPKNIVMVAEKMAGLASFIFNNARSADQMYRTLDEQEIKN